MRGAGDVLDVDECVNISACCNGNRAGNGAVQRDGHAGGGDIGVIDGIIVRTAIKRVVAGAAGEAVVAISATQRIIARAAGEAVVEGTAGDRIVEGRARAGEGG